MSGERVQLTGTILSHRTRWMKILLVLTCHGDDRSSWVGFEVSCQLSLFWDSRRSSHGALLTFLATVCPSGPVMNDG